MKKIIPALIVLMLCFETYVFAQQTIRVRHDGLNAPGCGGSGNPCQSLTYAITQANTNVNNSTPDIIDIEGGHTFSVNASIIINRSIIIRGAQVNQRPINNSSSRNQSDFESVLAFFNGSSLIIDNGVNYVTIEGLEFRSRTGVNPTIPLITFADGATNANVTIRRNIYSGDADFTNLGSSLIVGQQIFFQKKATGSLANIVISENRITGLGYTNVPALDINTAESGEIRSNVFGSFEITNGMYNSLAAGMTLSDVLNMTVARNEFHNTEMSALEVKSTRAGGNLLIEENWFQGANTSNAFTEPTIYAAILLRANNCAGNTLLIQRNDFQQVGSNLSSVYSIAIPNSYNQFTTNSIKIFENKFSTLNSGQGNHFRADLYVGTTVNALGGKIDINSNWWGTSTGVKIETPSPFVLGTTNIDIWGNPANVDYTIWLTNSTDTDGGAIGFRSNRTTTFQNVSANLGAAFAAIPEGWILETPNIPFNNSATVVRSFTLKPLATDPVFSGLTFNGNGAVVSLTKSISITNGSEINFNQGKIQLDEYNLTLLGTSLISGGNENSYIITNGTGKLIQQGLGGTKTGTITFPVGPDANSYTPAKINNIGAVNDFSVRAQRGVFMVPGDPGTALHENALDVTWDITNETPGVTPNVTLTLQWNADELVSNATKNGDEFPGFVREQSFIAHYNGTIWENMEWPASAPQALGGNVFARTVSGLTHFSPYTVGGPGSALPVQLVEFKAVLQKSDVKLDWSTASEKNNDHFVVERSHDGKTFSEIGKVKGKGTVSTKQMYTFTDFAATESRADVLYYRIKQVDTNGKKSYSKIRSVAINPESIYAVKLFPNPAQDYLTVEVPGLTQLQVADSRGAMVLQQTVSASTVINTSRWAKGIYVFHFFDGKQSLVRKVSVQ
jgi:hypothetical protein